jgi:Protein of unknown function (DUF2721)
MTAMKLSSVAAIADMVAPVVLITTGVLMANGLLSTYTVIIDRIRALKRERIETSIPEKLPEVDQQLATMTRRVHLLRGAVLMIFGAITSLVLAVVSIGMAEVHSSETIGDVALGFVIAGTVAMLAALVVVALAYAPGRGLLSWASQQAG